MQDEICSYLFYLKHISNSIFCSVHWFCVILSWIFNDESKCYNSSLLSWVFNLKFEGLSRLFWLVDESHGVTWNSLTSQFFWISILLFNFSSKFHSLFLISRALCMTFSLMTQIWQGNAICTLQSSHHAWHWFCFKKICRRKNCFYFYFLFILNYQMIVCHVVNC